MLALLFPGQGSQYVGMGRVLADRYPVAREIFEAADDVLGASLARVMWNGPDEELTATRNAQAALLVHSIAVHRVVADALGDVALAAGHSLGEFTAYVAAGAISFADGVRTVRRRGELMYESGLRRPGAMAAVLGIDDDAVDALCRDAAAAGSGECVPANYNAPGQVVISGDAAAVERAMELGSAYGARRVIRLNVSGAFHSPLMEDARAGLEAHLAGVAFEKGRFPVVSNVTAEPVRDPETARRRLIEQLTSPVRWRASLEAMRDAGAQRYVEVGAGTVLIGLLRRLDRRVPARGLDSPDQIAAFLEEGWTNES